MGLWCGHNDWGAAGIYWVGRDAELPAPCWTTPGRDLPFCGGGSWRNCPKSNPINCLKAFKRRLMGYLALHGGNPGLRHPLSRVEG